MGGSVLLLGGAEEGFKHEKGTLRIWVLGTHRNLFIADSPFWGEAGLIHRRGIFDADSLGELEGWLAKTEKIRGRTSSIAESWEKGGYFSNFCAVVFNFAQKKEGGKGLSGGGWAKKKRGGPFEGGGVKLPCYRSGGGWGGGKGGNSFCSENGGRMSASLLSQHRRGGEIFSLKDPCEGEKKKKTRRCLRLKAKQKRLVAGKSQQQKRQNTFCAISSGRSVEASTAKRESGVRPIKKIFRERPNSRPSFGGGGAARGNHSPQRGERIGPRMLRKGGEEKKWRFWSWILAGNVLKSDCRLKKRWRRRPSLGKKKGIFQWLFFRRREERISWAGATRGRCRLCETV